MKLYNEDVSIIKNLCKVLCSIIIFSLTSSGQTTQKTKLNSSVSISTAVPIPDAYYTFEGENLSVEAPGLKENDYDREGSSFLLNSFTQPSNGRITRIVTSGSFTYEPDAGFTGMDTYTYTLRDSVGNISESVPVTIYVIPTLNYNPIADPDIFVVSRDSSINPAAPGLFYNDFDPDGDSFSINFVNPPKNGTFNFSPLNGSFGYIPNKGFIGTDSLIYQIEDEKGALSEFTKVFFEVSESNGNIPIALEDNFATTINTALNIAAPGLLLNDVAPNDQTINASNFISPVNGTITTFNSNGSFSYKPNENFTGVDSFSYRIQYEENNISEFVKVTINVYDLNRPPYPIKDYYGVPKNEMLFIEAPGPKKNDFDPENDDFGLTDFSLPLHGTASISTDGHFEYEPDLGFVGKDKFTYRLLDVMGNKSEIDTVSIFVGIGTQSLNIRYIDPANSNSVDGMNLCTDPNIPCKTIDHAISVAGEGDTLEIAPSIYTETLTIDKTLILNGAGQDIISGTVIQAHTDSGMATNRVIFVQEGNDISISDLIIRHGNASGGGASGRGGGIRVLGSKLNLDNVTIEKNKATYGGGIHNSVSYGTYNNVTFRNNTAVRGSADNQGTGGGIYNFRSSPILNEVNFLYNKADRYGGAIRNTDESSPVLADVEFNSNLARFGGGMFNSSGSSPELTRVEFLENKADSLGGGMYNSNSSPRLEEVVFNADSARSYGGGMYNTSESNPNLFDVGFNNNYAQLAGGGMLNKSNSSPILTKVNFNENSSFLGGAILNSESFPEMINVIIMSNTAVLGGGIYNVASSLSMINGIIIANKAKVGGGVFDEDSSAIQFLNVTISNNSADTIGGGISNFNFSSSRLTNSIVWNNKAVEIGNEIFNDTISTNSINYSIFSNNEGDIVEGDGFVTEHSLNSEPLFVDAVNGNFHLQKGSPAIDAGDPNTDLSIFAINDAADSVDLDGKMRLFNDRIDIGAYEFQGTATSIVSIELPGKFILQQNYPNPFNPTTKIKYSIPSAKEGLISVQLKVFDILGREVTTLVNEEKPAGNYEVTFNASGLASGVYFYTLTDGNSVETKKMLLLH